MKNRIILILLLFMAASSIHAQPLGFAPIRPLNPDAGTDNIADSFCPIAMGPNGTWMAVWRRGGSSLVMSLSMNYGENWSTPVALWNVDGYHDVATDGHGRWIIAYAVRNGLNGALGSDQDLLFSTSIDNGSTWTPPQALNSNAATDNVKWWEDRPRLRTDRAGRWVALWGQDDVSDHESIENLCFARSTDNGATWTSSQFMSSGYNSTNDVGMDASGTCIVLQQRQPPGTGELDVYYAYSRDAGTSWSTFRRVRSVPFADQQSRIATDGMGHWMLSMRSDHVYTATTSDPAIGWSTPVIVDAQFKFSYAPVVSADPSGNWLTLWRNEGAENPYGPDADLFISRSQNFGITWTPAQPFTPNAASDSSDEYGDLTCDNSGHWLAIIKSNGLDGVFGTRYGTDYDLFITTSTNLDPPNSARVWVDYSNLLSSPVTRPTRMLADLGRFGRGY